MGVKLSELAAGERTVTVPFGGQTISVTYRLADRTPANSAVLWTEPVSETVVRMVTAWDLTDDKGKALPITEKTTTKVPIPILRAIVTAILGDAGLGEAASSSDAG